MLEIASLGLKIWGVALALPSARLVLLLPFSGRQRASAVEPFSQPPSRQQAFWDPVARFHFVLPVTLSAQADSVSTETVFLKTLWASCESHWCSRHQTRAIPQISLR